MQRRRGVDRARHGHWGWRGCARSARRAPMLARRPAAPGERRGHRAERRARRHLPGAARGLQPPGGRDARGGAGHRQDAIAAGGRGARGGGRLRVRRDHGRRGDPRAVPRRAQPVRVPRHPRHGRGDAGRGLGAPGGRGHLGSRRTRVREPVTGCQAPARLRPRGRRDLDPGGHPADRAAHRRRPVGGRRHPAAASLRGQERRRPADLPVPDDPAGRVRIGDRGRQLRRGHGADGARPAAAARTVQLHRDGRAPEARPRRPGRGRVRGGHARPVRGCAIHRRGAGAHTPRRRHPPADRRRVAARSQRRPPRPVRGTDAHRSPCRATAGPDLGRARRRRDPRPELQPARPASDPGPSR